MSVRSCENQNLEHEPLARTILHSSTGEKDILSLQIRRTEYSKSSRHLHNKVKRIGRRQKISWSKYLSFAAYLFIRTGDQWQWTIVWGVVWNLKDLHVNHGFKVSIRLKGFLKFWFHYNVQKGIFVNKTLRLDYECSVLTSPQVCT